MQMGRCYITDKIKEETKTHFPVEIVAEDTFIFYVEGDYVSSEKVLDALKCNYPHTLGISFDDMFATDIDTGLVEVNCQLFHDISFNCDICYEKGKDPVIEDFRPINSDNDYDFIENGLLDIRENLIKHLDRYFDDLNIYISKDFTGLTISNLCYDKTDLVMEGFEKFKDIFTAKNTEYCLSDKDIKNMITEKEKE